jgi:hypothetical protein
MTKNTAAPRVGAIARYAKLPCSPPLFCRINGWLAVGTHITAELFKQEAGGLDIVHVPYRGVAGGRIALRRAKSHSGAPRPMKMGNTLSPWHYDAETDQATPTP